MLKDCRFYQQQFVRSDIFRSLLKLKQKEFYDLLISFKQKDESSVLKYLQLFLYLNFNSSECINYYKSNEFLESLAKHYFKH